MNRTALIASLVLLAACRGGSGTPVDGEVAPEATTGPAPVGPLFTCTSDWLTDWQALGDGTPAAMVLRCFGPPDHTSTLAFDSVRVAQQVEEQRSGTYFGPGPESASLLGRVPDGTPIEGWTWERREAVDSSWRDSATVWYEVDLAGPDLSVVRTSREAVTGVPVVY